MSWAGFSHSQPSSEKEPPPLYTVRLVEAGSSALPFEYDGELKLPLLHTFWDSPLPRALHNSSSPAENYPESPYGRTSHAHRSATTDYHEVSYSQLCPDLARSSEASDVTVCDQNSDLLTPRVDVSRYSSSSRRHPCEILPPENAYHGQSQPAFFRSRRWVRFNQRKIRTKHTDMHESKSVINIFADRPYSNSLSEVPRQRRFLHTLTSSKEISSLAMPFLSRVDPLLVGARKTAMLVQGKQGRMRSMSYRERKKYMEHARIEINVTSLANRQMFLVVLTKALVRFCAPSHRLEAQLLIASQILEVECRLLQLPTTMVLCFGEDGAPAAEVHIVVRSGQLSLDSLHRVHQLYREVVHDKISAEEGVHQLNLLLDAEPVYGLRVRGVIAYAIAALICPLAFGGSFVDLWVAGSGGLILFGMQALISGRSHAIYANVVDTCVTILVSFVARALSSIRSQMFCYSAISTAAIVTILPGFLVLCSALELGTKNLICGSVNLVYALIVTLFIAFGLQIGSDLYLLLDPHATNGLNTLAAREANIITFVGNTQAGLTGTPAFMNTIPVTLDHIVNGCFRSPTFPWYLQPFPWWTQFLLVPAYALACALANMQPFLSVDMLAMVLIASVGYVTNKVANHFILGHSDIVSAIGAFSIGILGNIYSRRFRGTAFTVMVPGVLFLVPSGLSQNGGLNTSGTGIETGYEMVAVVVGIVVGLFVSQAFVYLFGNRKNAASFSF
ncbi:uncharacterized protein FIBRA_06313 [Fibroporia radiculosa]|uniref:Threonine/serine exporter-like N-terminal domain-containing protein n=1 Tax=Fibroporia radiculosa TaxID=599839 RepID=J4IB71_9APHY|nr:uncharacterized protein FIBRA_06313 [Fibroporia radiculosa]CCM04151.1 predicted protein [Fibroporia radiculosa]